MTLLRKTLRQEDKIRLRKDDARRARKEEAIRKRVKAAKYHNPADSGNASHLGIANRIIPPGG